jgi:hypothetical protein
MGARSWCLYLLLGSLAGVPIVVIPDSWWYTAWYDTIGLSAVVAVLLGARGRRTGAHLTWWWLASKAAHPTRMSTAARRVRPGGGRSHPRRRAVRSPTRALHHDAAAPRSRPTAHRRAGGRIPPDTTPLTTWPSGPRSRVDRAVSSAWSSSRVRPMPSIIAATCWPCSNSAPGAAATTPVASMPSTRGSDALGEAQPGVQLGAVDPKRLDPDEHPAWARLGDRQLADPKCLGRA